MCAVFSHTLSLYRIYIELAEQYAIMDAVSNVAKRNVLADHLRDVIDILESKVRFTFVSPYVPSADDYGYSRATRLRRCTISCQVVADSCRAPHRLLTWIRHAQWTVIIILNTCFLCLLDIRSLILRRTTRCIIISLFVVPFFIFHVSCTFLDYKL